MSKLMRLPRSVGRESDMRTTLNQRALIIKGIKATANIRAIALSNNFRN